ncbi:hypothetical protein [Flectobacillus rivi]|uniref:Lipoprotein n=1 Tax=Flectobacillus rivi TaxID=2984209 RepID=A0ABT6Z8C3_9BACT|nr:hypothetical protein [Flectobacillus rivi]MDI9877383.1 hypothetical protein [Flectobacillus rivi]
MKEKLLFTACFFILNSCNMSDGMIELPGNNAYYVEGSCTNRLSLGGGLGGSCNLIESVKDLKFNDDFICAVSTDSISCRLKLKDIPIEKRKYTVIDVRNGKVYCYLNKSEYLSFWQKYILDEDIKVE